MVDFDTVTVMLSSRQRLAVTVVALAVPALVVAGCTAKGGSNGGSPTSTSAAGGSTSSAKPSKSARPSSIDLKSVDPCQLLTPQQRQQLSLDQPPIAGTMPAFDNAKSCSIRDNVHDRSAAVTVVTTKGIEAWADGTYLGQTQPITVAGFPALAVRTPDLTDFCNVEVDVSNGQFLDLMFSDRSKTPLPLDQLCQGAQQVAEAAMTSLKASH